MKTFKHVECTVNITPKRERLQLRFTVDYENEVLFIKQANVKIGKRTLYIDKFMTPEKESIYNNYYRVFNQKGGQLV